MPARLRIRFPQEELCEESNALEPEELLRFLSEMRTRYPHHHAMVTLLAFTGLRFCHASALKWEDWDEDKAVLHVRRKHVRGEVAPVSRKKRAPGVIPVEPEFADVLRDHRARLAAAKAPDWTRGGCSRPMPERCGRRTHWTGRGRSAWRPPR
jgi:integrase